MSERLNSEIIDKYEEYIYDETGQLAEFVDMFDSYQEELFTCIELILDCKDDESFYGAKMMIRTAIENYIENLEMLSTVIFDQIERGEAVKIWATLVHDTWEQLDSLLTSINPMAGFSGPEVSDLQINAIALFDGMQKKRNDKAVDDFYDQHTRTDQQDEYGNWVLDEQRSDTFNYVSRLLELHQPQESSEQ